MGFLEGIGNKIKESFEKKRQEREHFQKLQKEIQFQQQQEFEREYNKRALEVAKHQAREKAMKLSGYQKLQALRQAQQLENPDKNFMNKFSSYVQRNKARTQERLKRTAEMRAVAKAEKERQMAERIAKRNARIQQGGSMWG